MSDIKVNIPGSKEILGFYCYATNLVNSLKKGYFIYLNENGVKSLYNNNITGKLICLLYATSFTYVRVTSDLSICFDLIGLAPEPYVGLGFSKLLFFLDL
jgi:hypothetical protein